MHGPESIQHTEYHPAIYRKDKQVRDIMVVRPPIVVHGLLVQIFRLLKIELAAIRNTEDIMQHWMTFDNWLEVELFSHPKAFRFWKLDALAKVAEAPVYQTLARHWHEFQ